MDHSSAFLKKFVLPCHLVIKLSGAQKGVVVMMKDRDRCARKELCSSRSTAAAHAMGSLSEGFEASGCGLPSLLHVRSHIDLHMQCFLV